MTGWLDLDARLSAQMHIAERPGGLRRLAAVLAHSGDSWFWLLGLGLLWLWGTEAFRSMIVVFIAGILLTALLVFLIKFTVRRQRPAGEWGKIYRSTDPHSFPSGHAARAAMLSVLAIGLGPTWLAALLLLWAPLVGLARVAMGVHYLSDVVAGIGVGIGSGLIMLRLSGWF
jgi:undecaprenyl-diphosphatase